MNINEIIHIMAEKISNLERVQRIHEETINYLRDEIHKLNGRESE
jgi:hypothetical protein